MRERREQQNSFYSGHVGQHFVCVCLLLIYWFKWFTFFDGHITDRTPGGQGLAPVTRPGMFDTIAGLSL
jgi:hypothetical protein